MMIRNFPYSAGFFYCGGGFNKGAGRGKGETMGATCGKGMDRRSFFKGAVLAGGVAALGAMTGCNASNETKQAGAEAPKSEYAQAAPVAFAADHLVDPAAEWELVTTVENSGLIEGMNFKDGELWLDRKSVV